MSASLVGSEMCIRDRASSSHGLCVGRFGGATYATGSGRAMRARFAGGRRAAGRAQPCPGGCGPRGVSGGPSQYGGRSSDQGAAV
eukprot:15025029-Alexandrium_andersonii.AAC.1